MLNLFLLAGKTHATGSSPDFEVALCNRLVDNEPEMTIRFSHDYFEQHMLSEVDEFTYSEYGYEKTIPEDELLTDFDDDCKFLVTYSLCCMFLYNLFMLSDLFLNYHIYSGGSRKRREELFFDDISLNDVPGIRFTCKYERSILVDFDHIQGNPGTIDSDIIKTGILEYTGGFST